MTELTLNHLRREEVPRDEKGAITYYRNDINQEKYKASDAVAIRGEESAERIPVCRSCNLVLLIIFELRMLNCWTLM